MASEFNEFFEVNAALLEIGFSQTFDRVEFFSQFGGGPAKLEADTAATCRAFDHDRKSDLPSGSPGLLPSSPIDPCQARAARRHSQPIAVRRA